jgi:hypothetical protein
MHILFLQILYIIEQIKAVILAILITSITAFFDFYERL